MADLHADVAGRMRALEGVQLRALERGERGVLPVAVDGHVDRPVSEFGEGVDAGLGGPELFAEAESGIRCEGRGAESGDEDVARLRGGIGDDAVRALDQPGPQAALQERLADLSGIQCGNVPDAEVDALLLRIGLDEDGEQLALLAPDDLPDRAADGRGQENVSVLLVRQDGGATEHAVSFLDQKPGEETFEVSRLDCHDARGYRLGDTECCLTR